MPHHCCYPTHFLKHFGNSYNSQHKWRAILMDIVMSVTQWYLEKSRAVYWWKPWWMWLIIPWKITCCIFSANDSGDSQQRHKASYVSLFQFSEINQGKPARLWSVESLYDTRIRLMTLWLGELQNSIGTFSRRNESWCSALSWRQRRHTNKLYLGKLRISMEQPQQRPVGVARVHFLQIGEVSHALWKVSEALNAVVSCWTP